MCTDIKGKIPYSYIIFLHMTLSYKNENITVLDVIRLFQQQLIGIDLVSFNVRHANGSGTIPNM